MSLSRMGKPPNNHSKIALPTQNPAVQNHVADCRVIGTRTVRLTQNF